MSQIVGISNFCVCRRRTDQTSVMPNCTFHESTVYTLAIYDLYTANYASKLGIREFYRHPFYDKIVISE